MAALIAVDAREPLMKVTAVEKSLEDLGLYRPVDQPGRSEFHDPNLSIGHNLTIGRDGRLREICVYQLCIVMHSDAI